MAEKTNSAQPKAGRPSPRQALAAVLPNLTLRRVLVAEATVSAGTAMTLVVLTIIAFNVGGARLVGFALSFRYLGVGILRPIAGVVIDRLSPLAGVRTGSGLLVLGAGACLAGGAVGGVAGVSVLIAGICVQKLGHSIAKSGRRAAIAVAAESPAQASATVGLVSLVVATSGLVGPTLAAGVLVLANEVGALALGASLYGLASASMWRLPVSNERPHADVGVGTVLSGQRETLKAPTVIWTFVLAGTSSFLNAALGVFYAPLVVESLDAGSEAIGYLRSGFGTGAIIMSVLLLSAPMVEHPTRRLAAGVALFAVMIAVIEPSGRLLVALLPMLGMGAGKTLIDTAYLTHLQRALPDGLQQRVLGLGETVIFMAGAIGSLAVIPLLDVLSLAATMAITGGLGVVVAILAGLRLRRLETRTPAPLEALTLLRQTETFGLLPPIELDLLALRMQERELPKRQVLESQGDPGNSWFIIASGEMDVAVDGTHVATMGPGESFGEIALLRSCSRTATITASSQATVLELDGTVFRRALGVAEQHGFDAIVDDRLGRAAPAAFDPGG